MSKDKQSLYERCNKVMPLAANRVTKLAIKRGEGSYLITEDGERYLDFASGVAVCNIGHNHQEVVKAAKKQMEQLIHGGHNVVYYKSYVELAEKLVELTGGETMVYFSNSGAEANEGAVKLAKYATKRPAILAFKGSFHGRTLGTISLTGSNSKYRKNYEGLLPGVYFAEYPFCFKCPFNQEKESCLMECISQFEDDIFKRLIDPESLAAIIIEPIQGEGGYINPPKEFMKALRRICDQYGIVLIYDEIQTGFGRTGKMFAYEHFDLQPDIITSAKGIASGFPLSAVIAKKSLMEKWPAGAHGGTYGGNPISCAASLATIKVLEEYGLKNADQMASCFSDKIADLRLKYSCIADVRGIGLMIGLEFEDEHGKADSSIVSYILSYSLEHKLILLSCGTDRNVLRFITPTTVSEEEIAYAINTIESAIEAYFNK